MPAPKLRCRKCRQQGGDGLLVEPHSIPHHVICVDCGHSWRSKHPQANQRLFPMFYTPAVLAALAAQGD